MAQLQGNELVTLGLALLVALLGVLNWPRLRNMPAWRWFSSAFGVLLMGWILTVLETLPAEPWSGRINLLEHACYGASSVLMAGWCWVTFWRRREG